MKNLRLACCVTLLALTGLSGCGVDGEPEPPQPNPGFSVSGEARLGIAAAR